MTEDSYIEERVRRTLNAVAGQPIPSAPPAFEPGRPRTRHPLRIVSVALVVAAVAAAVTLALIFGPHSGLGKNPSPKPAPASPPASNPTITPGSSKTGLTRFALPGPYTGYATSGGALAISPNGRTAYVGDSHVGLVTPVDLSNGRAERPITLGPWGINAIAITPSGRTAYVVEGGVADAIIPIDLSTRTVGPAIHVAGTLALGSSIAITPDGHMAYVDSVGESDFRYTAPAKSADTITHITPSYVVPIDLGTNTALRPISLDPLSTGGHIVRSGAPICGTNCAFEETIGGIAITPDGRTAYVSQDGDVPPSGVFSINLSTEQVGPNISIFEGAFAEPLAITPDGRTVYIAGGVGTVTPIDLASQSVGSSINVVPAGEYVAGMAISPNGGTLVVDGDPDLASINLRTGMVKTLLQDQAGGDIAIVPNTKVGTGDGA